MKEQICSMFRDDEEIQKRICKTEAEIRTILSQQNVQFNRQMFVCRSQETSKIYGFMECQQGDTFYCYKYPEGVRIIQKYCPDNEKSKLIETIQSMGYIEKIAVHKDYRRHGISQALLNYFEEKSKLNGMHRLMIHAETNNQKAINAYTKAGFVIAEAYSHNKEILTMFKSID
ncbi:GNAT family N-acetyltransferase [Candidatus Babeliales bacterium]|nr:GNAT family N-acetyltransferase [Candidatus Babeliales bacterium]MBP9844000.1 GNAT family N-acetyltransferase [Candidatus Babeliales bacterium]